MASQRPVRRHDVISFEHLRHVRGDETGLDDLVQTLQRLPAAVAVVERHAFDEVGRRRRIHAVRPRDAPRRCHPAQRILGRPTSGGDECAVEAIRSEALDGRQHVVPPTVDGDIGTEASGQRYPVPS